MEGERGMAVGTTKDDEEQLSLYARVPKWAKTLSAWLVFLIAVLSLLYTGLNLLSQISFFSFLKSIVVTSIPPEFSLFLMSLILTAVASERIGVLSRIEYLETAVSKLSSDINQNGRLATLDTLAKVDQQLGFLNTLQRLPSIESKIDQITENNVQIETFFGRVVNRGADRKFYDLAFKYATRKINSMTDDKTFEVNDLQQGIDVWLDCILIAQSWRAISYTKSWLNGNNRGDRASKYQKFHLDLGNTIQRVFVFREQEEYDFLLPIMTEQRDMGIDVRYAWKKDLDEAAERSGLLRKMKEFSIYDFAVQENNNFVSEFILDQNRKITGTRVSISPERADIAHRIFNAAISVAKKI